MTNSATIHATCVSLAGRGILLCGESGSGKSDLALRLIDGGAELVADDQVRLDMQGGAVYASAPGRLRGLLEIRGVGILTLPYLPAAPVVLAVKLVARERVERMPEPKFMGCLDAQVPLLSLHAFDHSTPAKIRFWINDKIGQ